MTLSTLKEVKQELEDTATLIAAYSNPHVHHDLSQLSEEEVLTTLFLLEAKFENLLSLRAMFRN